MSNFNELLTTMKKAAVEAVEAGNPVSVCFGKVTSASPLRILVDQKMTLSAPQLVLTKSASKLKKNEEVALLRMQGGQKYVVLDRMGGG